MKKIQIINEIVLTLLVVLNISCVNDDEITIAPVPKSLISENFNTAIDNTDLDIVGWTNISVLGTKKWKEEVFSGNGYAEFSAFNSTNAINEAWLISPKVTLEGYTSYQVFFDIAQHHLDVDAPGNSITIYYSNNFDGTNAATATWVNITPSCNIPVKATAWYEFLTTKYNFNGNGQVHFAFKFIGSGTNTTLDGAFQLDNFKVFGIK
jgi:hypothetical protein